MCKTATVVTESTVSEVSDLQKTMFRNVTAVVVVVAVFTSGLVSPINKTDLVILNGNVNARRYSDNVPRPVALPFYIKIMGEETLCTNMSMTKLILPASLSIF